MKRGALFVERKRLADAQHALAVERVGGKLKRHDPPADAARHLVHRQAIGGHRVPHPDEADVLDLAIVALVVRDRQQRVPNCPEPVLGMPGPQRVVALAAIIPVGGDRLVIELGFAAGGYQTLIENQADDDTDGEGAATEAEAVDIVAVALVVAAGEFVDVDDVPLQAEAERAAKNRPRLERGGADAVVVECDLVISRQVQRLEGAPDICAPDLRRGIARAVGQQNNVSAHAITPRRVIKQFRKPLASKRCMSIPDRKDFIGDRESRIVSVGEWTPNNKAAGRRLVVELSLCHQKILERAKGFEPSTPTLASLDILLTFINDAERFCA